MGGGFNNIRNVTDYNSTNKLQNDENNTLNKLNDKTTNFQKITKVNSVFLQDHNTTVSSEPCDDSNAIHGQNRCNEISNENKANSMVNNQYFPTKDANETLNLFDFNNTSWLELPSHYQPMTKGQIGDAQSYPVKLSHDENYSIKPYQMDCETEINVSNSSQIDSQPTTLEKQLTNTFQCYNSDGIDNVVNDNGIDKGVNTGINNSTSSTKSTYSNTYNNSIHTSIDNSTSNSTYNNTHNSIGNSTNNSTFNHNHNNIDNSTSNSTYNHNHNHNSIDNSTSNSTYNHNHNHNSIDNSTSNSTYNSTSNSTYNSTSNSTYNSMHNNIHNNIDNGTHSTHNSTYSSAHNIVDTITHNIIDNSTHNSVHTSSHNSIDNTTHNSPYSNSHNSINNSSSSSNATNMKANQHRTKHINSTNGGMVITQTQNIEISKRSPKKEGKEAISKPKKTLKVSRKESTKQKDSSKLVHVWRLNKEERLEKEQQRNRMSALKYRRKKIMKEMELKKDVGKVMLENNSLKEKLRLYENIITKLVRFIHYHMDGHDKSGREDLGRLVNDIKSIDKVDIEGNGVVEKFLEDTEKGMD